MIFIFIFFLLKTVFGNFKDIRRKTQDLWVKAHHSSTNILCTRKLLLILACISLHSLHHRYLIQDKAQYRNYSHKTFFEVGLSFGKERTFEGLLKRPAFLLLT